MEDTVRILLEETLIRLFEKLKTMEPDTKEYDAVVKEIQTLYNLRIEDAKIDFTYFDQQAKETLEKENRELETAKLEEQRKEGLRRSIFDIGKAGLMILANGCWIRWLFEFEKTGAITSKAFGFIPKILKG